MEDKKLLEQLRQLRADFEWRAGAGELPLAHSGSDLVHGEGAVPARLVFLGEAPGAEEQASRRPFVGRAGRLLRQQLAQLAFNPDDYYFTNLVKARPPANRDPLPEEIEAYRSYLEAELLILQPSLICTLGRFSLAKFLPGAKISHLHGQLQSLTWQGRPHHLFPLYHPAAALRSSRLRTTFHQDLTQLASVFAHLSLQSSEYNNYQPRL